MSTEPTDLTKRVVGKRSAAAKASVSVTNQLQDSSSSDTERQLPVVFSKKPGRRKSLSHIGVPKAQTQTPKKPREALDSKNTLSSASRSLKRPIPWASTSDLKAVVGSIALKNIPWTTPGKDAFVTVEIPGEDMWWPARVSNSRGFIEHFMLKSHR